MCFKSTSPNGFERAFLQPELIGNAEKYAHYLLVKKRKSMRECNNGEKPKEPDFVYVSLLAMVECLEKYPLVVKEHNRLFDAFVSLKEKYDETIRGRNHFQEDRDRIRIERDDLLRKVAALERKVARLTPKPIKEPKTKTNVRKK